MQEVDQEIIKNAKVDLALCFTWFLGGKIHDFHVFRKFLTFGPKSEKIQIFTKMCTFGPKMRKMRIFMKITKNCTFSLFSRPLRKCCSSTRNIDGFGSTFRVLERKVLIFEIFMKIRTFLTFEPKSAHFSLLSPKVGFLPQK